MANKVSNFTELIQRVTASCLLNPLVRIDELDNHSVKQVDYLVSEKDDESQELGEESELEEEEKGFDILKNKKDLKKMVESEAIMSEMFDAVSDLKKAYVSLQEAHSPWDPVKMSVADVAVVKELKRIGRLKERFRRMSRSGGERMGFAGLREAVAPYEETVEELKREVKAKEAEVENLKEKLRSVSVTGKKGKLQSKRRVSCSQGH
ncbi:Gravitropic in the light, partial [Thalictrum thalictroides]